MDGKTARAILLERNQNLQRGIDNLAIESGKTAAEIIAENPFIAGQAFMLNQILLDWIKAGD